MKYLLGGALALCLWGVAQAAPRPGAPGPRPGGAGLSTAGRPSTTAASFTAGGPRPSSGLTAGRPSTAAKTTKTTGFTAAKPIKALGSAAKSTKALGSTAKPIKALGSAAKKTKSLSSAGKSTKGHTLAGPKKVKSSTAKLTTLAKKGGGKLTTTKTTSKLVSTRFGVAGVRTRLSAKVRSLPLGKVHGGCAALPVWLTSCYGGQSIVDLGCGRFLFVGSRWDGCAFGLYDPLFVGCNLPVVPCDVATVPTNGVGPLNPANPGTPPEVPEDVPADVPPEVPDTPNEGGGEADPAVRAGAGNNQANVNQARFLKVSNQTNNNVKVFVQADNMKKPMEFNFKPGESNHLGVGKNQRLAGNKVRFWAESGTKNWSANKNKTLDLTATPNKSNNVGTVNFVLK